MNFESTIKEVNSRKQIKIVLMGKPGSGKDEQGKRLSVKYRVPHMVTGDIIRQAQKNDADLNARMIRGELATFEEMTKLFQERISQSDVRNGFILNGIPRTLRQMKEYQHSILDGAIYVILEVSDEIVIQRVKQRAVKSDRPEDADEIVIKKRLKVFQDETTPAIDYINANFTPIKIDASQSIENVYSEINDNLQRFLP